MVSLGTLSPTGGPNSRLGYGRPSVAGLGLRLVCPLGTIHRPTGRRSGLIRCWRLRCVTTSNPASWSKHLPWVEYSLNTMVSSATGLSPFQCSLGYQPPLFPSQETEVEVSSIRAQLRRCRRVWGLARKAMVSNSDRVQRAANQKVWLLARDLHLPMFSRKLAPRFVGPYEIEKVVNPSALRLRLPPSLKIHVSQVKPVATSTLSPSAPTPPPPRVLEGGDLVWEVSRILAARRRGRGFQYLVDWVGYGPEDRSWVPRSYLADPGLLVAFYDEHPRAVGRSPGVSRREGGTIVSQQAATPTRPVSSTEARADAELPISSNADQLNTICRRLQKPSKT